MTKLTFALIVWFTGIDWKHALNALGATHFCPPIAAQGSARLESWSSSKGEALVEDEANPIILSATVAAEIILTVPDTE